MNTVHANLFASFIPFAYRVNTETEGIENVIQAIHSEWLKVSELAASAKKALFAVNSHRRTFETALNQKESTRRRAVIDKQVALCCNYTAADYAFRFFGKRLVQATRILAGMIPALVKDCNNRTGTTTIDDARRSNTVVCTRIISELPDALRALAAQFQPDDVMKIASGSGDLIGLSSAIFDHNQRELFAAPLCIAYHYDVISEPAYIALEEELVKMAATVEKAELVAQAFERARSLACNQEQFQSRLANVTTPEQARSIVKEADAALVDYRAAAVALDTAVSAIYHAHLACEQQLKAAPKTFGDSASGLWGLVQTNRIAAKCLMENAMVRRGKMKGMLHGNDNHDLRMTSYHTLEATFDAIPATFQFPFLSFLNCN